MAEINCPICKKETVLKPGAKGAIRNGNKKCDACSGIFEFYNDFGALTTIYNNMKIMNNGGHFKLHLR